jgi:phosphatidylserine/phosphatidylglycerophosphate/cardiolipin synthase-like enzyme
MSAPSARQITALFVDLRRRGESTWDAPAEYDGAQRESIELALRALTILADQRDALETTVVPALTSPRAALRARRINMAVDELLRGATDEIVVIGYELSERGVLARLAERASVGVRVEIIVDGQQTSIDAIHAGWPRGAGRARVWTSAADGRGRAVRLHAKALIADGRRALIGSANFTASGMRSNLELGVVLDGPAVRTIRQYAGELIRRNLVVARDEIIGSPV